MPPNKGEGRPGAQQGLQRVGGGEQSLLLL